MNTNATLRSSRVLPFFVLTFAITWSAWGAVVALDIGGLSQPLTILGGLGPIIAAGLLSWYDGDLREWSAQAIRWRVGRRWWAVALIGPAVLSLLGYALYLGYTGVQIGFAEGSVFVIYAMVFLIVFFLRGGMGEEMGWRGYALPALMDSYSALTSALIIGVVWAGWHIPQFFVQDSSQQGPFAIYLLGVIGLSVILSWLYVNARGSVLLVVVFHTQWNVFDSGAFLSLSDHLSLLGPAASTLVIWAIALLLILVYGRSLRSDSPESITIGNSRSDAHA